MATFMLAAQRAALDALFFSGAHQLLRPFTGGVGTILMLHHVRPARGDPFQPNRLLEVDPAFLERLIARLRRRRIDFVSLDEVHRRLMQRDFGRFFVAVTLDDGYRDNLEHAWPILQRHGVPFTIFVATSFADRIGELWWVALERVIAKTDRLILEIDGQSRFFESSTPAAKRRTFEDIYWWLRALPSESELRRIVRDLSSRYGIDWTAPCREFCMTWPEIASMAADPLCTVGAHTVNHVMLSKCPESQVREEMKHSADVIQAALGHRPRHFAYPVGDATTAGPREFRIAAELGFLTAVTTRRGVLFAAHREHLTALPRISVNGNFQAVRYLDVLMSGAPFALASGFRRVNAA